MICRGWGNISTHKIVSLRYLRIYTYIMSLLVCLSLGFKILSSEFFILVIMLISFRHGEHQGTKRWSMGQEL